MGCMPQTKWAYKGYSERIKICVDKFKYSPNIYLQGLGHCGILYQTL